MVIWPAGMLGSRKLSKYLERSVYIAETPTSPQPRPCETTPARYCLREERSKQKSGPPLSPVDNGRGIIKCIVVKVNSIIKRFKAFSYTVYVSNGISYYSWNLP